MAQKTSWDSATVCPDMKKPVRPAHPPRTQPNAGVRTRPRHLTLNLLTGGQNSTNLLNTLETNSVNYFNSKSRGQTAGFSPEWYAHTRRLSSSHHHRLLSRPATFFTEPRQCRTYRLPYLHYYRAYNAYANKTDVVANATSKHLTHRASHLWCSRPPCRWRLAPPACFHAKQVGEAGVKGDEGVTSAMRLIHS